jgi:hypothetical protein
VPNASKIECPKSTILQYQYSFVIIKILKGTRSLYDDDDDDDDE